MKGSRFQNQQAVEDPTQNPHYLPPPPFTIKEIRDAVPAHLFERSALKSGAYLALDLLVICLFFYLASFIEYAPVWARFVLWPTYWFVQGVVMTGVWVIGHECGHQSFSDSKLINNSVGLVLHSLLLVPYHAWRITHSQHHKSNCHMERDQVFVPAVKEKANDFFNDTPLLNFLQLLMMWFIGWPGYLLFNVASQEHSRRANHFEPNSPLFEEKHRPLIVVSDIVLLLAIGLFAWISHVYGFVFWAKYYFVPYLWVNFWLVTITYLQHTDIKVPHYRGDEWSFIRGALATVDRDYGFLNHVFHHIGDSHVAHHLFSTMPHYNAIEATKYLKPVLGKYYLEEKENVFVSLWRNWQYCHWVESTGNMVWWKNSRLTKQQ